MENYTHLLKLLESQSELAVVNGVEVNVKRIPDLDLSGVLDPRVYEHVKTSTEETPNKEKERDKKEVPIETIRAQMGWPNKDVTSGDITTESRVIKGENGDIPIRMYIPNVQGDLPAILFFHGGGFIGGSLKTVENPCKALAEKAQAVVISVDYRLAPEHPFPQGLQDCFDVVTWVYSNSEELGVNKEKMAVSGDSAGGNLATVCCLWDKEKQTNMINYQALIYPVVNIGSTETEDFSWSIEEYEIQQHHSLIKKCILGLADAGPMFNRLYLQGLTEQTNPYVSPLLANDVSGLPEALIITAEFDYLRLEGEAYARKLSNSGVKTKLIQYNGMDHAFIDKIGEYPQAEDCMNEIAKGIKAKFAAS